MADFRKAVLTSAIFLLSSASLALAQGTYTQIDFPGASQTECFGVDSAGDIVGEYYDAAGLHGFLLSAGTYTTIDYNGYDTALNGINDTGQVVGESIAGFVYDLQTQIFTTISYPGSHQATDPVAINNAGTIAGDYFYQGRWQGFELAGATYSQIAPPNASNVWVHGISGSGELVGLAERSHHTTDYFSFSYAQGGYSAIRILHAPDAGVIGVSPAGDALVGAYSLSSGTAFVYRNQTLQALRFPGAIYTIAAGVNNAGEVIGDFYDSDYIYHGFTWTPPAEAEKK
jgi:uncharacterized membrane protein